MKIIFYVLYLFEFKFSHKDYEILSSFVEIRDCSEALLCHCCCAPDHLVTP